MERLNDSTARLTLNELLELHTTPSPAAAIAMELRGARRPIVSLVNFAQIPLWEYSGSLKTWFGTLRTSCGDAPDKIHPKFLMAILSSRVALKCNTDESGTLLSPSQWSVPEIVFSTEDFVRRSMTLNGMRMTTEYFGSGSTRVLRLVEQRLDAGQRDVVHDILVYLANQITDIRAEASEARALRAEAVAAYLGIDQVRTEALFQQPRLSPARITRQIEAGAVGSVRRPIDIAALVESQIQHLQPAIMAASQAEKRALRLLDRIAARLYGL